MAMGGHVEVLWQPWEFVIILGTALGTFIVANPMKVIKDVGKGIGEAFGNAAPTGRHSPRRTTPSPKRNRKTAFATFS